MISRAAVVTFAAYLGLLVALTLGASPGAVFARASTAAHRVDGLVWVTSGDVERVANVLLFVPAGLLLCFALPAFRRWAVWALCVTMSFSIEIVQFVLPDRDSSPIDVVTNSAGAALGVLFHAALTSARHRRRR
jgi:glycopeptide antibiotics resistance protein